MNDKKEKTARVINFGSINIDNVYRVKHLVKPGETINSTGFQHHAGGKGLNQSIALAQAGANVHHSGNVGVDGEWLLRVMHKKGVNTDLVQIRLVPNGNAIIQVSASGENSIILFGGANLEMYEALIKHSLEKCNVEDYLLVQNEINLVPEIIRAGKTKGMTVVFNPAPMTPEVLNYPLEMVDILIMNETEALGLTGESEPGRIYRNLIFRFPNMQIVLTLGSGGSFYLNSHMNIFQSAKKVTVVDTTGAGDTFIGYFLAEMIKTNDPSSAMKIATRAAAIAVTRPGAADSIPGREEVLAYKFS